MLSEITSHVSNPNPWAIARQGAIDTLPMVVAAVPFGLLFGMLAPTYGISAWFAVALSALVFAGSAQYVAIGLVATGTPAALVVLTTLIVNLRHLLYALALMIPMQSLQRRSKLGLSFLLTDETFVTVSQKMQRGLPAEALVPYYLGSAVFMYVNWQLCTWLGLWAGGQLQGVEQLGLEFALVTAFLAMLSTMLKHRANIVAAVVGFTFAWFTRDWPHKTGIIFSVVMAASVAAFFSKPVIEGAEND